MTTTINAGVEKTLYIGKQGENLATRVDFGAFAADCLATFGTGTLTLVHERAEDPAPYPIMPVDGRYWDVTSADLQYAGTGYIEATYVVGEVVKKSLRWKTVTLSALGEVVEPPEAWLAYIERVTQLVDSVQNMTVSATKTDIPTVTKSMDAEGRVHLTFGLVQGEKGFSPVVKLTPAPDGVNISVKDATSESTQLIKHGLPGKDGVNPTLKLERTENGVRMTATDKEGITSQVVKDGKDGKDGADGKDGSDADVTSENIKAALGYTPADDAETVKNASFETLKTTVAGKLDKPVNEPWTGAVPMYDGGALKWHTSVYSVNGQTGNVELPTVDPSIERRLTNLEYAANGVLYREDVSETEDYEKPLAPDVMPYGTLDKIAGTTIVMNQLVGDTYPEPFEGEVFEQTIEAKAKTVDVDSIGGKTVVWNQLYRLIDGRTITEQGVAFAESTTNGTITANGTSTGVAYTSTTAIETIKGHKYLMLGCPQGASNSTYRAYITGRLSMTDYGEGVIQEATDNGASYGVGAYVSNGYTVNNLVFRPRLYDLTAMFGAGNEPDIETFKKLYDTDYYSYSTPVLRNLDVREVVSKGKNLLDVKNIAKIESLSNSTTYTIDDDGYFHVKKVQTTAFGTSVSAFIELPAGRYFAKADIKNGTLGTSVGIYSQLDVKTETGGSVLVLGSNRNSGSFVLTENTRFRFYLFYATPSFVGEVVFALQIEKVTTETEASAYQPHFATVTRDPSAIIAKYFPTGMKSAGTAHDTIDFKRGVAVQRVESVDMGALPWTRNMYNDAANPYPYFRAVFNDAALGATYITPHYSYSGVGTQTLTNQMTIASYKTIALVLCRNDSIDNAEAFRQSVSGDLLYYELATPIETPIAEADLEILKSIPVEQGGALTFDHIEGFNIPLHVTETLNLSEWSQPLDTTHKYNHNGSLLTATSEIDVVGGVDTIVDMTRAGCDDLNAYVNVEPVKNDGELVSKEFDSVVSRGRNLCNLGKGSINVNTGADAAWNADNYGLRSQYIPVSIDKTYDVLMSKNDTQRLVFYYDNDKKYIERSGGTTNSFSFGSSITGNGLSFPKGTKYVRLSFYKTTNTSTFPSEDPDFNVMVRERGKTMDYAPYFDSTTPLSTILSKYFPDGMRSAGAVKDELDIENGVAVKRVNAIHVTGVETWGQTGSSFETTQSYQFAVDKNYVGDNSYADVISDRYSDGAGMVYSNDVVDKIAIFKATTGLYLRLRVLKTTATSTNELKAYLANNPFDAQYVLPNPVTTPIAPEDLEALRTLHVEAGGSLTFIDTNAGYHLPCVNKETFLVKTGGD